MSSFTKTQSHFANVPDADVPRSTFDRSSGVKTTLDAGKLYPIFCDEVLPGDTVKLTPHLFGRLSTPFVPFMDNLYMDTHFFFVPHRLVWENWERFNGAQTNPSDTTDYVMPTMKHTAAAPAVDSIYDHFGIPLVQGVEHISAPLRCYNLIWNEWFRDQNLQNSVLVHKGDTADPVTDYVLLPRNKRKDYFTSGLPWPQKGPSVNLPLGLSAPVYGEELVGSNTGHMWQAYKGAAPNRSTGTLSANPNNSATSSRTLFADGTLGHPTSPVGQISLGMKADYGDPTISFYKPPYADLSEATAATINSLRLAFQIQKMYERDARGGTRYVEILRAHWNVTSPDFRLQRPEFLSSSTTRINATPIAQTSSSDDTTPQGNLAAMATVSDSGRGFNHSFVEHGYIIGLVSVRADLNYQQGLNRMWSRKTRFDFYWPALAHLGEQVTLNKEIYYQALPIDDEALCYQERYAEYRYKPNEIHGKFRSGVSGSLDIWHLAQNFTALPLFNDTFIRENPPVSRVLAVQDEPQLILDCHFKALWTRAMPTYSVPGLVDHF